MSPRLGPGRPWPMGATPEADGVNFCVFSAHATAVLLCLFDADGRETARIPLPERTGDNWHGLVHGLGVGQLYGYRCEGPYVPGQGLLFNPHKLLVDPYTHALDGPLIWDKALLGHREDLHRQQMDRRDSAAFVPRSVVTAPMPPAEESRPGTPWTDTVIYEAHVKGLTMARPGTEGAGTYLGLADPGVIRHLKDLGVTAVELLPIQGFIEDAYLADRGRTNYWGYQTLTFLAPERRYAAADPLQEVREMVRRLHAAGLEVILDVVYNHTGEGDGGGPTLAFRGLDNASYYRLGPDGHSYINDTGTGNCLDAANPAVQRLILDSLRFWAGTIGVDGFRFDLATILGREGRGFDPGAGLFDALRQDPLLSQVKLIAEPWDIGPGGYQLGGFPAPFAEWNDLSRDTIRGFWRGDKGLLPVLSGVVSGSARQFDCAGRPATASVNFVTAHDGFTLMDVVSYDTRHNAANGEDNRDGHGHNLSDNMGVEGPTEDATILAERARRRRNMLATVLLSQGTPMILAGDELGNSQGGNNNAYVQDNETGWIDWSGIDAEFLAFVQSAIALRHALPMLGQARFLHAETRADGAKDLLWLHPDGGEMADEDWGDESLETLVVIKRMAAPTPDYLQNDATVCLIFNQGAARPVALPNAPKGRVWATRFSTDADPVIEDGQVHVPRASVAVMVLGEDGAEQ